MAERKEFLWSGEKPVNNVSPVSQTWEIGKEKVSGILSWEAKEKEIILDYSSLTQTYFDENKDIISNLISSIWWKDDAEMALSAIVRSFTEEEGSYYYLIKDSDKLVGLTGYYEIDSECPIVGLNHHGIIPTYRWKWLWKQSLLNLIHLIKVKWYKNFSWVLELVPTNNQEIENTFRAMWFTDYTQEALHSLDFIKRIIAKWYYNKAYLLRDNSNI